MTRPKTDREKRIERGVVLERLAQTNPRLRERLDTRRAITRERAERAIRSRDVNLADVRELDVARTRSLALSRLDQRETVDGLSTRSVDSLERAIRDLPDVAQRVICCEDRHYRSAFAKYVLGKKDYTYTDDERAALVRYWDTYHRLEVTRAQSEGTPAAGGYAVPPSIDPTIIITDYPNPNPYWQLCSVHDIEVGTWKGITSPASSWSIDGEATEVSDDSTTIAQPVIPTFTARGFVPYSIEIGEDWPGFADEMTKSLNVGYQELTLSKFTTGAGTTEPTGILTALAAASGTTLVTSAVDGAFSDVDIQATWNALPARFQANAIWMASSSVTSQIRQHSSVYHASAVTLDGRVAASEIVNGHQLIEAPYFPAWTSTTGAATRLVVGDWSQFHIARRRGLTVELVPLLMSTSNNRPSGERGLLGYARIGSDCPNVNGFRYQANT